MLRRLSTTCRSTTARSRRCGRATTRPTASRLSLDTLVPDNPNKPYDMKELILKTVDEGDFFELQPELRQEHHHRLRPHGRPDGGHRRQPAAGAGRLPGHQELSIKAARFVRFCDAFNIPVVTFVDVPGFMPGTSAGIRRHHQARRQAAVTPMPSAPCRRSPSSPARPMAAPMT
jgi:propionyl-CoA carboxylase beta chain